MRRVETIIDYVRKITGNVRYDANSGIDQTIMSMYLNFGQDELQKAFVSAKCKFLQKSKTIPVVSGQEEYSYPSDIFLQAIDTIQWSMDDQNFVNVWQSFTKYRTSNQNGYAFAYYNTNSGFILTPPLPYGNIYVNYMRKLPTLACRAGQITTVTINGSNQVTALVVATTGSYNASEIASDNYLCVVDYLGNIKATGIQYSGETAGTFTVVPTTLQTGETAAVGDYIVVGKYATNKAELPDICENFLILQAYYQVKYGDTSQWTDKVKEDLAAKMFTLMDSINNSNQDINQIPITNFDALALW